MLLEEVMALPSLKSSTVQKSAAVVSRSTTTQETAIARMKGCQSLVSLLLGFGGLVMIAWLGTLLRRAPRLSSIIY